MRFFTVSDAKAARKSVFYATGLIGYFYVLTFIIGFGAITWSPPIRSSSIRRSSQPRGPSRR